MYDFAALQDPNFWTALPSILWVSLIVLILLILRRPLAELISHFITRVRAGAPMKIGYVEFGAIQTEQLLVPTPFSSGFQSESYEAESIDEGADLAANELTPAHELSDARENFYEQTRRIMLVHRVFRSTKPGQIYDVLIYIVPRAGGTLVQVTGVEYFFGRYWGNQVFTSYDRSRGFPILTSAYGTFLCCARISFNDGDKQILFRHIDFEMGAYAPVLTNNNDET